LLFVGSLSTSDVGCEPAECDFAGLPIRGQHALKFVELAALLGDSGLRGTSLDACGFLGRVSL
jgi:hypothetical protein